MFNIARRGPASVARSLFSSPTFPRYSTPAHTRDPQRYFSRTSPSILEAFRSGYEYQRRVAASRRCAATNAAAEAEAIEGEIEQESVSQTPPSDNQIKKAVQHGSVTKFKDLVDRGMVCGTVVDTITNRMGLETMTQVQSLTITQSLKGKDILAQARTGTGKTLAFLIPLLQNIINVDPKLEKPSGLGRSGDSTDIRAIIVSPTRELAEQIAEEARKVTRDTGVIVQTAVGGSAKIIGLRKIRREGCHILVGTPGRLNDLLSDPYSQVRAPNLSCFVLDEADRLLDIGFAPDIQRMQDHLPNRREIDRQTLLYSATVPREVMRIVRHTMKPDFQFVRTVQEGEQQTHEKVPQKLVTVPGFENYLPALLELCKRELSPAAGATGGPARPFKAIVYFSATASVSLTAAVLNNLRNPGRSVFHQSPLHPATVIEIHGKLSQEQRTRAADSFRRADSAILLSSDVTARGMDFPNVTHVIQVGLPVSQEQYVHRIGRTGRGDKTGEGWILLTKIEANEIRRKLPDMPLQPDYTLETAKVDMRKDAQLPEHAANTLIQVGEAMKMVPLGLKTNVYMASMTSNSWWPDKQVLVDAFNDLAKYGWGMESPPMISPFMARKMNLTRVNGISIGHEERKTNFADNSRDQGMRNYGGGRGSSGYDREGGGGRGSFGYDREGSGSRGGYGSPREGGGGRGGYGSPREGSGGRGGYGSYQEGGGRPSYGERSRGGFGDRGRGGGYGGNRGGGYGDRDRV